ncbi:MAG: phosphoribosylaminoimidazolesuccinocarboxamide synthase [Halobacteriaceae archaeon]
MTSVKEFRVDRAPDGGLGRGRFYFTDAYSVFDWGQMPDDVPGKGQSLCATGAATFEALADAGVPTHYRGVVPPAAPGGAADGGDGAAGDGDPSEAVPFAGCDGPPREMAIDLATVPDLPHGPEGYDYEAYHDAADAAVLVPLEIVFRNVVPVNASLRKRTEPGDHGLDLTAWPDRPVDLPEPVVEFSTKFEDSDRYLDRAEAARIAGPADLADLEDLARAVDEVVTERAAAAGFTHQDGKIECLAVGGEVRVADVAGTFDENRFAYDGVQVSKEFLRRHYRATQPEWVAAVSAAKRAAREAGEADWKARCERTPDPLPDEVREAAADLYAAGANAYVGRPLFDAPSIDAAVERVRALSPDGA